MTNRLSGQCPLCFNNDILLFFQDRFRSYYRCSNCKLIFVPERYWLDEEEEKATYDLHENNIFDQGYRNFLSRLTHPLLRKVPTPQQGLDFGCGPGPALSIMLEEHGHKMDLFDPLYYNNRTVFTNTYDFICATEVAEHLRDPYDTFRNLFSMVKPGGLLGLMTKLVSNRQAFSHWHYIRDMTHICFYSVATFNYLAKQYNAQLEIMTKDVIFFKPL